MRFVPSCRTLRVRYWDSHSGKIPTEVTVRLRRPITIIAAAGLAAAASAVIASAVPASAAPHGTAPTCARAIRLGHPESLNQFFLGYHITAAGELALVARCDGLPLTAGTLPRNWEFLIDNFYTGEHGRILTYRMPADTRWWSAVG